MRNGLSVPMEVRIVNALGIEVGKEMLAPRSEKTISTSLWNGGVYILRATDQQPVRIVKQ